LFSLEVGEILGGREGGGRCIIHVYEYVLRESKEDGARLLSVVPNEREGGTNFKTGNFI